jgi:fumarate hydratase class II
VLANREKAQSWLERNAIIVTALNPLIGYAAGAELVKESLARSQTVFEVARQRLEKGELRHRDGSRSVTEAELEAALGNLRRLTEGGIVG